MISLKPALDKVLGARKGEGKFGVGGKLGETVSRKKTRLERRKMWP